MSRLCGLNLSWVLGLQPDIFENKAETAQLSRPRRRRRDQETNPRDQSGYYAIFATFRTGLDTARFLLARRRRHDQEKNLHKLHDQGGDGETQKNPRELRDRAETAGFSRPRRIRRDRETIPRERDGHGATFATKAETLQLYRLRRIRRNQKKFFASFATGGLRRCFHNQVGEVATIQTLRYFFGTILTNRLNRIYDDTVQKDLDFWNMS